MSTLSLTQVLSGWTHWSSRIRHVLPVIISPHQCMNGLTDDQARLMKTALFATDANSANLLGTSHQISQVQIASPLRSLASMSIIGAFSVATTREFSKSGVYWEAKMDLGGQQGTERLRIDTLANLPLTSKSTEPQKSQRYLKDF